MVLFAISYLFDECLVELHSFLLPAFSRFVDSEEYRLVCDSICFEFIAFDLSGITFYFHRWCITKNHRWLLDVD